jgi:radical SAM superfamily enzyme YgiQ (UPF0313 family)
LDRLKRDGRPLVFAGGQLPSYNPSVVAALADVICIGDAEESAPAVLRLIAAGAPPVEWGHIPGVYVSALDNCATWQQVADISGTLRWPFRNRVVQEHDSGVRQEERFERRLEIARGCKRKCAFCGVSWTKRYRENDTSAICEAVRRTDGAVKAFAPDPMAHSGWEKIDSAYVAAGKHNQARDISTKIILQHGFGRSRIYSTGIDGLSERLRFALNKPLLRDELVEVIERASGNGGQLHIYQILDLPGEQESDYAEWFECLARVKVRSRPKSGRFVSGNEENFYLVAGLNAFCPTPHTPLQWEGITLRPECWDRYRWALDSLGPSSGRRLKHKTLARPHKAASRLLEAAALRGDMCMGQFVLRVARERHKFTLASQVFAVAERIGVAEALHEAIRTHGLTETLPWERRVKPLFPRAALERAARKYREHVGLLAN